MPKNPWKEGGEEETDVREPETSNRNDSVGDGTGRADVGDGDAGVVEEHPVFAEAPTVSDDLFATEDSVPDTEVVEGKEGEKLMKVATFEKRVGKLISQREKARGEAKTADSKVAAAEADAKATKEILASFREAYRDAPHLAVWDAQFMAKLEVLAKRDADIQPLIKRVQAEMEGETTPRGGPKVPIQTPDIDPAQETAAASRLNALDERMARVTIKETLVGLKPAFVKILSDHIVNTADKLDGLTAADVVNLSRDYLAEAGIDKKDALATAPKADDSGPKEKPSTGGSAKAGVKTKGKGKPGSDETERKRPKDLEEWQANRDKRRAGVLKEFEDES